MKKFNKKVLAHYETETLSLGYARCYLCQDGDYVNVYILDEVFRQDELNCLDHQIPIENMEKLYLTDCLMHAQIMQKDMWNKFGHFNESGYPLSFEVRCYNSEDDKYIF